MLSLPVIIKLKVFYLQVMNATNAEPAGDNQTGEQSNLPIAALPDVDVVSTTKYVVSLCVSTFCSRLLHLRLQFKKIVQNVSFPSVL